MPQICIKPISVNSCWQGRRFRTDEFKVWQNNVLFQLRKVKMIKGWVRVELVFYLKNYGMTDVDNLNKASLDCLVKKGYIEDDRKIVELYSKKIQVKDENKQGFDFLIEPIIP